MDEKNGHGGARKGAWRKANDRSVPPMVRVSPEAAEVLDGVKNKSEFIDSLIKNNSKI